jgi:putative sigma-54 modulation protein
MKLDAIKATNIELTDAIKTAVEATLQNLAPLTERYDGAARVHVEIGKTTAHHHKGDIFRAEINITIPGKVLRGEAEKDDLYAAIEAVEDALKRQLTEEKDRFIDSHR